MDENEESTMPMTNKQFVAFASWDCKFECAECGESLKTTDPYILGDRYIIKVEHCTECPRNREAISVLTELMAKFPAIKHELQALPGKAKISLSGTAEKWLDEAMEYMK